MHKSKRTNKTIAKMEYSKKVIKSSTHNEKVWETRTPKWG